VVKGAAYRFNPLNYDEKINKKLISLKSVSSFHFTHPKTNDDVQRVRPHTELPPMKFLATALVFTNHHSLVQKMSPLGGVAGILVRGPKMSVNIWQITEVVNIRCNVTFTGV